MDKRFEKLLLIFMVSAFVFLLIYGNINTASGEDTKLENQYPGIMRFHVIANSDSEADQELKLNIRDYVLERIQKDMDSKDNSIQYIYNNLDKIQGWAEEGLKLYNSEYKCETSVGVRHIPAKYYDDLFFPEGNYEALTITIGEGKGQNWWCVVFPPLCLVDSESTSSSEEMEIDQEEKIILKSKIKELMSPEPVYRSTVFSISNTLSSLNQNLVLGR